MNPYTHEKVSSCTPNTALAQEDIQVQGSYTEVAEGVTLRPAVQQV
jgi:hypothetical protein